MAAMAAIQSQVMRAINVLRVARPTIHILMKADAHWQKVTANVLVIHKVKTDYI